MKLLIAGYGFVGKAVQNAFSSQHNVVIIDPKYTTESIKDHLDADCIIVCVPTPESADGSCDISIVEDVIKDVPIFMPVLIKSTVPPSTPELLKTKFERHSICYSPEFLRARSANQDFLAQRYIVLGGDDPEAFWHELFTSSLPNCKMVFNCTEEEACLVKYASNSFLALKTSYFNQLYDICLNTNMDFDTVKQIIGQDTRIGLDHTTVPGLDGQRGWGGHCFPKDTKAFIHWANSISKSISLVESAVEYNHKVRKNS